jgi:hypothetical protein
VVVIPDALFALTGIQQFAGYRDSGFARERAPE